jgi:glutamate 5-kinase
VTMTTQSEHKRRILPGVRRVVVKLGSSVVTTSSGVDRERVGLLVAEMARMHSDGIQLVVVTSGARAGGLARLGLKRMPRTIPEQQAAAAIGQIRLMSLYEESFATFGKHIGQMLLTAADLEDRARYLNAKRTLEHLLCHGIVPVVNENDSVAVEELKFGDNDRLSALVAGLASADLLIVLTDVDGLFRGGPGRPGAELIEIVNNVDDELHNAGSDTGTVGTGGMASKLAAARSAAHRGIPTLIANGRTSGALARVLRAEQSTGTLVLASDTPISNRKHWIAYGVPVRGSLVLDAGAVCALAERGGSLLPSGVVAVDGDFAAGECVRVIGPDSREFARGLVTYDAEDCRKIKGLSSRNVEHVLGYHMGDEVIHRDDLVLLDDVVNSGAGRL